MNQDRKVTTQRPFGAPYGHGSSYTPATDGCAKPFVPSADRYSPPATTATGRPVSQPQIQQFPLTK